MNGNIEILSGGSRARARLSRAAARFRDWWDGSEEYAPAEGLARVRASMAGNRKELEAEAPSGPPPRMTPEKLELTTRLWGEGFHEPLGKDYVADLVKPFALNEKMSVLDLGAGLGGGTRAVAERFKVWITGMEPDPDFAAAAMQLSIKHGLKTRAPIIAYEIDNLSLPARKYGCIFAKETFYRAQNKRGLLAAIAKGTANDGQVLFTDFVLRKPGHVTPEIAAWSQADTFDAHLWSGEETREALNKLKFETRVDEDITPRYRSAVLAGWHACLEGLGEKRPPRAVLIKLLTDAELWVRRLRALESGDLQVRRYHAFIKRRK